MRPVIIVEGKNDRMKLSAILDESRIDIYCTYGTTSNQKLQQLAEAIGDRPVYIFTDNDHSGQKIRGLLKDAFPDAEHIHTCKGYAGVEGTPDPYLIERLEKSGLENYLARN